MIVWPATRKYGKLIHVITLSGGNYKDKTTRKIINSQVRRVSMYIQIVFAENYRFRFRIWRIGRIFLYF